MNLSGDRKLMEELGAIMLDPIKDGKLLSPPLKCSNLWKDKTAVIFAIRRPGCYLCREEGLALTKLERSGKLKNCVLFGVIKEVEEGSNDLQGIQSFQKKYFPYPIYRDELQQFYGTLGYGNWISLLPGNPLTLVTSVAKIAWRISCHAQPGLCARFSRVSGIVLNQERFLPGSKARTWRKRRWVTCQN